MRIRRSATVARLEHDQLVAADARAPVGDRAGKRRRDHRTARSRASTITKSLPRPCILWKCAPHCGARLRERAGASPPVARHETMPRAANDVMQSILFSAVLDALAALKRASGGLPNQLLRDVQAIHPNVTFADLPKELQDADRREHARRVHPAAEGRLCGRPAPADAADAADRPGARARPAPRPPRSAATGAARRADRGGRRAGDGPGQGPGQAAHRARASRKGKPQVLQRLKSWPVHPAKRRARLRTDIDVSASRVHAGRRGFVRRRILRFAPHMGRSHREEI